MAALLGTKDCNRFYHIASWLDGGNEGGSGVNVGPPAAFAQHGREDTHSCMLSSRQCVCQHRQEDRCGKQFGQDVEISL